MRSVFLQLNKGSSLQIFELVAISRDSFMLNKFHCFRSLLDLSSTIVQRFPHYSSASLLHKLKPMGTDVQAVKKEHNVQEEKQRMWTEVKLPVPWGHVSGKWWGNREQQPVIALHGWQDNAGTFDRLIPLLPEDIPILAIDLPGHGFSSHIPKGQAYYLLWDGPLLVRRLVKENNWQNITILGHSLGGIIGFMYAALFPTEVEKLIQIDIANPTIRDVNTYASSLSKMIDTFLHYENLSPSKAPCYQYEEMIKTVEDAYKGSVTLSSSQILMKRGMAPSPKGDGFLFARDLRLKVAGFGFPTLEQVLHLADNIKCKCLNIRGNPGMTFDKPEYYDKVLDVLRKNTSLEYHRVEGTHHLHLNTPERVSDIITNFLQSQ